MLIATLVSTTITALVLILAFPETPAAKWLHRILVEAPALFLEELSWAKLGQVLISFAVVMFLVSSGPEGMALLTAAGVDAAMLEVMLAIWLVSVSNGIGTLRRTAMRIASNAVRLARFISAPRNRSRSPRTRKFRPPRKNDDQPEPVWAFA